MLRFVKRRLRFGNELVCFRVLVEESEAITLKCFASRRLRVETYPIEDACGVAEEEHDALATVVDLINQGPVLL